MSVLQTIGAFLVALLFLVFVHEWGHYFVAKCCGVKILRFSIGFGPALVRWTTGPDRTEWVFAAIPLGGYVRMLDENDQADPIPAECLHRSFSRRSVGERAAIAAAGPVANFLLAIVLYAVLGWVGARQPVPLIDHPAPGSAAALAGLKAGDQILQVDGQPLTSWGDFRLKLLGLILNRSSGQLLVARAEQKIPVQLDLSTLPEEAIEADFLRILGLQLRPLAVRIEGVLEKSPASEAGLLPGDQLLRLGEIPVARAAQVIAYLSAHPGQELSLTVRRGATEIRVPISVAPNVQAPSGKVVGRIGALLRDDFQLELFRYELFGGLQYGVERTWEMSKFSLVTLGKMLTGALSIRHLGGPLTMADLAGQSAKVGLLSYIAFLALVSVSLGVLNLLPIPVLDGGYLLSCGLEALLRRPLSPVFLQNLRKIGAAMVILLMLIAFSNDLIRFLR